MKTKKIIILNIIFVQLCYLSNAQTNLDALRYSGSSVTGTARFTAMAGAFGALGGDFSSLSYNPAGIGVYRSNEFTFTPSITVGSTSSTFIGQTYNDHKDIFNIGNAGLVYTYKLSNDATSPGWKSWNFGIGYNRMDNYNYRSYYSGQNPANSKLDNFAENATGNDPSNLDLFYENLAYNCYMINPDANNRYTSVIPSGKEIQSNFSESNGSGGETVFTFGGNYSNKFFVGGMMGIKSIYYSQSDSYEEYDPDTLIPYFKRFKFQQDYRTHGTGIDLKFGMIYKVNDIFRFGFAFESPTWYSMHDDYQNSMVGYLDTGSVSTFSSISPSGAYDYDLTTPLKVRGSVAFVFGTYGLLSADYEFSDYSQSRFYAPANSFSDVNNEITQNFNVVNTVKIGTEWLLDNVSLRGGYAYSTSPINSFYQVSNYDFSKNTFSAGIGYRESSIFFDLGYAYTISDQYYQPYTLQSGEPVPGVKSSVVTSNFVLTMGVKF